MKLSTVFFSISILLIPCILNPIFLEWVMPIVDKYNFNPLAIAVAIIAISFTYASIACLLLKRDIKKIEKLHKETAD